MVLTLACALLGGCKAARVYPLAGPQSDMQALFDPLIACAGAEQLEHRREEETLHVQLRPGVWAQFTPRRKAYTVVLAVEDGSRGGDRESRFAAGKRKSEALFACARNPPPPVTADGVPVRTPEAAEAAAEAPAGE